ncbi:MAG: hypothetical protein LBF16_10810 [Pseudomonadales bacterium]|jgi:hypothetical protein|nr:hypothetical protein [Pseudomonadales bacterium]
MVKTANGWLPEEGVRTPGHWLALLIGGLAAVTIPLIRIPFSSISIFAVCFAMLILAFWCAIGAVVAGWRGHFAWLFLFGLCGYFHAGFYMPNFFTPDVSVLADMFVGFSPFVILFLILFFYGLWTHLANKFPPAQWVGNPVAPSFYTDEFHSGKRRKFAEIILLLIVAADIVMAFIVAARVEPANFALAESQIVQFHERLNSKNFAEMYEDSNPQFKELEKDRFIKIFRELHEKLGPVVSSNRKFQLLKFGGAYVITYRNTVFAHGKAEEKFVYRISDGKAVLIDYYFSSSDFRRCNDPRWISQCTES